MFYMSTNLSHGHYQTEERWTSYWYQIETVMALAPKTVLEIGKGSGITSFYLREQGVRVTTLDLDPALKPDVTGSVEAIPLADASFDVVLCAEVLEHLPFEKFRKCLSELRRTAKDRVVVSLPHWGWGFALTWKLPLFRKHEWFWKLTGLKSIPPGGEHFWEIGRRGYPL